jgi:hypothetical protein
MSNYPDGMTARDWQHIEGVPDCEEQGHWFNRQGFCRQCGQPDCNFDPDAKRDREREEQDIEKEAE